MANKFPKRVYVRWYESENDDPFLLASEDIEDANDGTKVGVYELVETKTKRVRHSVE